MPRTVNPKRPEELRAAIVRYLVQHGLADLSLRPLAKAVGSSPRVLLYYFGSKEKLIVEALAEVRRQQKDIYGRIDEPTFSQACRAVWKHMSAPASAELFRLFLEIYGIALRHPRRYKSFLDSTIEDSLRIIASPLENEGCTRSEARAFATVVLAGLRGFMLDYCTTGDRKRLDPAVERWARQLDAIVPTAKEKKR